MSSRKSGNSVLTIYQSSWSLWPEQADLIQLTATEYTLEIEFFLKKNLTTKGCKHTLVVPWKLVKAKCSSTNDRKLKLCFPQGREKCINKDCQYSFIRLNLIEESVEKRDRVFSRIVYWKNRPQASVIANCETTNLN